MNMGERAIVRVAICPEGDPPAFIPDQEGKMNHKLKVIVAVALLLLTGRALAQFDLDGDGILDGDDNCILIYNPVQTDVDDDSLGDLCDPNAFFSSQILKVIGNANKPNKGKVIFKGTVEDGSMADPGAGIRLAVHSYETLIAQSS